MLDINSFSLERRDDGVVVVRVPSTPRADGPLPEAVFAFRAGDPQYKYWERRLRELEGGGASMSAAD